MTTFTKFRRNPVNFIRRSFYKLAVAPFRYWGKQGYDAEKYWRDRFFRHGLALTGVGDEGLSEADNREMYRIAGEAFLVECRRKNIDFSRASVLEIGCGNGFYTELLAAQGVRQYLGLDITDMFFSELRKKHPGFEFAKNDITQDPLDGEFDLVIMIDVIEHITQADKLQTAFETIKHHLAKGGVFLVAPAPARGKKSLFYVRFWSREEIAKHFSGFEIAPPIPFRYNHMLAIRKP